MPDFDIALDEFRLITLGNSVRYYLGVIPVFSKLVVLLYWTFIAPPPSNVVFDLA